MSFAGPYLLGALLVGAYFAYLWSTFEGQREMLNRAGGNPKHVAFACVGIALLWPLTIVLLFLMIIDGLRGKK